ncbi:MAG: SDR family NAD(P)-dependent oxidoreductase [Rhodothermales bacterium]|nr:SDR family NAD(P)-dependent oxidoreductase [Rhodothermales bacterium]
MSQTIVITGCSSGFGFDLAQKLARRGDRVYATMRASEGKNAEAARALRDVAAQEGLDLRVLDLDVTSDASVRAAAEVVHDEAGGADVVVNNAGQMFGGITEAFTPADVARQLDVNVVGVHRVNRAFLPAMRERGAGLLLNVTSIAGRLGCPFFAVYQASKWALEGYSLALRGELASLGVDVVVVEPGPFATELFPNLVAPEDADGRAADYPAAVHQASDDMGAAFASMFDDPAVPTDPALVVDRMAELIAMAPGTRPFRSVVGIDLGVAGLNEATAPFDAAVLDALGLADFATLRTNGRVADDHAGTADAVTFEFDQTATGPSTFEGTFTASGAISDAGTTEDALDVSSPEGANPMVATFRRTVKGRKGTLVLTGDATVDLADPAEAEVSGSWRVERATGAYAGHTGSGTIAGTADMTLPQPHGRVRYAGQLRADG